MTSGQESSNRSTGPAAPAIPAVVAAGRARLVCAGGSARLATADVGRQRATSVALDSRITVTLT